MKKILLILLTLMMLVSCTGKKDDGNHSRKDSINYIEVLENYEPRKKNQDNQTDNPEFDEFLDKIFIETMESDFLTMHFSVVDYKKFGIEKPPVDIGVVKYGFDQESFDYTEEQLKELQGFDFDKLSYRQQYDYEALEYYLYQSLASYDFYQFDFLFSTGNNLAENIISYFTDYTFYDEESVEDYLTCLADLDRFFDDSITYTADQTKDGYGLLEEWVNYTIDVCSGVLNKTEDNEYIVSFDRRMDEIDFLSAEQKAEYSARNKEIVLNEVLPAYEKLSHEIGKYQTKSKISDYALYKLNPDYAKLVYYLKGSNSRSIDEVFQNVQDVLAQMEAELLTCLYDDASYDRFNEGYSGGVDNLNLTGKECLEYLRQNLVAYYPDLGDVDYTVDELDPDTAPDTVIAYYWPSPVDNYNQNIIRTNPNNMMPGIGTYSTLSHEGFPGHLYQHVFYAKTNPHDFRSTIDFIGYTEGWAVNAQYYAFRISGLEDDYAAAALFYIDAFYFLLYSIIDIAINYYGWTYQQVYDFVNEETILTQIFYIDKEYTDSLCDYMIEMPGTFCSYGLGFTNFMMMLKETKAALGNKFDYISYHETLLKNGPLPFNILQSAVDEYIASK